MQNSHLLAAKYKTFIVEKMRDPVSGLTHLIAALAALVGMIWLLAQGWNNPLKEAAFLIYGISLVLLFLASGVYHLAKTEPATLLWLRKFDHSAIFLLIAGTYTPICLFFFSGFFQWGLTAIIWSMAITGIVIKFFVIKAPRWITAGIYLLMGWLCIMAIGQMVTSMPAGAIVWLITGGLFYSFGAVIYISKKPNFFPDIFGFHELWHIFVILGALSHFILIAGYIAPL